MQTHLLTDANLSDASNLQSDEEPSSSVANQSCQKISSQQSCILSKRYVIQNSICVILVLKLILLKYDLVETNIYRDVHLKL